MSTLCPRFLNSIFTYINNFLFLYNERSLQGEDGYFSHFVDEATKARNVYCPDALLSGSQEQHLSAPWLGKGNLEGEESILLHFPISGHLSLISGKVSRSVSAESAKEAATSSPNMSN